MKFSCKKINFFLYPYFFCIENLKKQLLSYCIILSSLSVEHLENLQTTKWLLDLSSDMILYVL